MDFNDQPVKYLDRPRPVDLHLRPIDMALAAVERLSRDKGIYIAEEPQQSAASTVSDVAGLR